MKEFNEQIENNLRKSIEEFNNNSKYFEIRELYKQNFDTIENIIKKTNPRLAIEDISKLDKKLTKKIKDDFLLIQEINRAIINHVLTLREIK